MPTHVRYRLAALAALVVLLVVLAATIDVPSVSQLRSSYSGTGVLGELAFVLLYAALSLLPIPATVFTLATGAVFGVTRGLPIVWAGATLGAVAAFYLGRLLGRDAVSHFTGSRLEALDTFLDRHGFVAVLVARLIPFIPYSTFNYLSGLTQLRPARFTVATAFGIIPSITIYTSLGAYGNRPGSWPFLAALAALVVLLVIGLVAARRRRRHAVDPAARAAAPVASQSPGDAG